MTPRHVTRCTGCVAGWPDPAPEVCGFCGTRLREPDPLPAVTGPLHLLVESNAPDDAPLMWPGGLVAPPQVETMSVAEARRLADRDRQPAKVATMPVTVDMLDDHRDLSTEIYTSIASTLPRSHYGHTLYGGSGGTGTNTSTCSSAPPRFTDRYIAPEVPIDPYPYTADDDDDRHIAPLLVLPPPPDPA